MDLTPAQLEAQFRAAGPLWPFVEEINATHGLPPRLLWALASRETDMGMDYSVRPARRHSGIHGDNAEAHGLFQQTGDAPHKRLRVAGRPHAEFDADVRLQAETAARKLAADYAGPGRRDWIRTLNIYNSGQGETRYTTRYNYGPDVWARQGYLASHPVPTPASSQGGGIMESLINVRSGLALDVAGHSKDNGAAVIQWTATGSPNQGVTFEPIPGSGGLVRIRFDHSADYLDAELKTPGKVQQWAKADERAQGWQVLGPDDGGPWVIVHPATNRVLEVPGGSKDRGKRLQTWPRNDTPAQQWVRSFR